jgi:type 1 fimbria pilin
VNCLPPASFRIVAIARESNNVRITWTGAAGTTNMLQAASSLTSNFSTGFTDVSQPIIMDGCGEVTTNYVDVGVMSSTPARYYRIRLVP